jgi:hypothetical protein
MMKSVLVVLGIIGLFFTSPVLAQHSAHHPGNNQAVRSDSAAATMSGSMMGNQGMMSAGMMGGSNMMQRGMMGNMMGGSHGAGMCMMSGSRTMQNQWVLINTLPELKGELSLTDSQVEKLGEMKIDFKKRQIDLNASHAKKQIDLNTAIDKGASVSDIRSIVEKLAEIDVNKAVQTYEFAGNMKNVLNEEQKEKVKDRFNGTVTMMGSMMR